MQMDLPPRRNTFSQITQMQVFNTQISALNYILIEKVWSFNLMENKRNASTEMSLL
jgi:hypothetical protein